MGRREEEEAQQEQSHNNNGRRERNGGDEQETGLIDPLRGFSLDLDDPSIFKGLHPILIPLFKQLLILPQRDNVILTVLILEYVLLISYSFFKDWICFGAIVASCVFGIAFNGKFIKSMLFKYGNLTTTESEEKFRMTMSLMLFVLRFFLLDNRVILTPMYVLVLMSSNTIASLIYTLAPFYVTFSLYFGSALRCLWLPNSIEILFENLSTALCIYLLSYYVLSTSSALQSKIRKLEQTTKELEMALSSKEVFIRHISHEFRSPCLSSLGSVELLRETNLTEYQRELVETIASSDGILLNLIEDVLTLVKIEHEKKSSDSKETTKFFKVFKLDNCVKMIGNIIKSYSTQFQVKVNVSIDEEAKDQFIRANQTRIHQIISNLMTNSVKASKIGDCIELKCFVRGKERTLNGVVERDVVFKVSDHGIGIPKSKQSKIFEPFAQLHNLNQSIIPGSGLGLSTVLHNVQAMRGEISLESEENSGAEFTVVLPLEVVKCELERSRSSEESLHDVDPSIKRQLTIQEQYIRLFSTCSQSKQCSNSKAEILIADDNSVNRRVIAKLIESIGYSVDTANDGKQLIELFDKNRHKLIITDLNMPILDGIEATKILRNRYHDDIKVVALTGDVLVEKSPIFDQLLTKPVHKAVLKECIDSLIKPTTTQSPTNELTNRGV